MKQILTIAFLFQVCFFSHLSTHAQVRAEKINLSYWYVFGRFPSAAEMNYWNGQPEQSLSWYISNHHNYLRSDKTSQVEAVRISYIDAFGRNPSQAESDYWVVQKNTYADMVNAHVNYLISDSNENKNTIKRAYQQVLGRQPSSEEMNLWSRSNFSFVILNACLQSYKTSGTYRLQSAEAVAGFLRNAWETSANFVVNSGKAIYNATASTITASVAAAQNMYALVVSSTIVRDINQQFAQSVIKAENGFTVIAAGIGSMVNASRLINLDGAGLKNDPKSATLIGAGAWNLIGAGAWN
jgi:hypothetical protein